MSTCYVLSVQAMSLHKTWHRRRLPQSTAPLWAGDKALLRLTGPGLATFPARLKESQSHNGRDSLLIPSGQKVGPAMALCTEDSYIYMYDSFRSLSFVPRYSTTPQSH